MKSLVLIFVVAVIMVISFLVISKRLNKPQVYHNIVSNDTPMEDRIIPGTVTWNLGDRYVVTRSGYKDGHDHKTIVLSTKDYGNYKKKMEVIDENFYRRGK